MKNLLTLFPFIKKSQDDFEFQYKLLNKVTLTGKINSDNTTTNLFEFAENTSKNLSELKKTLITLLLKENINTISHKLRSKAEVTIDILIRNLFERTADVGFLATDSEIINFLEEKDVSKKSLEERLHEYVLKYSVYNEILVFDTKGTVKAHFNHTNSITFTEDPIIAQTLQNSDYVERYAQTDIFKEQSKTLTYTQRIEHNGVTLGVLCLCFKFEDELERIFNNLKSDNETILLIEDNKVIASSNPSTYKVDSFYKNLDEEYTVTGHNVSVSAKTMGYQGYFGLPWTAVVIRDNKKTVPTEENTSIDHTFENSEIKKIIQRADDIVGDLADIIINGELIAAKRRMYILNPILDNLRVISSNLLSTIKDAGQNLNNLVQSSMHFNLASSSALAIDIMDRNLYERANDSRWWALTPLFIDELSKPTPDSKAIHEVLLYINELYTVYTNIFIYDTTKTIIASSHDTTILGKVLSGMEIDKTLSNSITQNYFVSDFVSTSLYENRPTYIYHASIKNENKIVGGIGIIFDSSVEFNAILDDSFTTTVKGLSLFIDGEGKIISSTSDDFVVGEPCGLNDEMMKKFLLEDTSYELVELNNISYVVASAKSKGYREYKVSDNYKNSVIALTFVEI